jgi:hypothetical protein|uniref:DUF4382 domain-containing protein n=1 Tax=candidate division WOR-3 bacterium TaxID=2052148 RepID=A0A7V3RHI5_UNCW3
MRYSLFLIILIIACAQNASVEVGINDGAILNGTYGDISVHFTRIEIFQNGSYTDLWNGSNNVNFKINSENFCSITMNYVPVPPGSYRKLRVTIDSLSYVEEGKKTVLLDSSYQFIASAFTDLIIEENGEYRFVINANTTTWFDPDSIKIKNGHQPFENASLKLFYQ